MNQESDNLICNMSKGLDKINLLILADIKTFRSI